MEYSKGIYSEAKEIREKLNTYKMKAQSRKIIEKHIATLEKISDDIRNIHHEMISEWENLSEKEKEAFASIISKDLDHLVGAKEELFGAILHLAHFKLLEE